MSSFNVKTGCTLPTIGEFWIKDLNYDLHPPSAIRSQDHLKRIKSVAPPNFAWIDKNWLAGCSTPTDLSHYRYLFDNGIRHLISFAKDRTRSAMECVDMPRMNRINIRISEKSPLSIRQIDRFIDIVEQANNEKEAVALHCPEGSVQAGVLLACYLIKRRRIQPDNAIRRLCNIRPGSINDKEQEKIIKHFYMFYFRPFQLR